MTHAYQEIYLNKAQTTLGSAFDYAINACKIPGERFIGLFTTSSYSKRMENGDPSIVAGKSGIEVAIDIVLETTGEAPDFKPKENFARSREYWIGLAVCYYQWFSARSYREIFAALTYEDLKNMYPTLHDVRATEQRHQQSKCRDALPDLQGPGNRY